MCVLVTGDIGAVPMDESRVCFNFRKQVEQLEESQEANVTI